MLTGSVLFLFILFIAWLCLWLKWTQQPAYGWRRKPAIAIAPNAFPRHPPKPEWVRKEIIKLKALMPHEGCRTIAHTFNRLYAVEKHMTVGKTFVANTIQKHQYDIQVLRRKLKHQRPRPVPPHLVWGIDLTYFTDGQDQQQPVLGIVEHHSRGCLQLQMLRTKTSIALLRCLLDVMETLGQKPRYLRTDNEAVFTSLTFRFCLWLMGIQPQRTEICCPWQNGKVERFFGTLKAKSKDLFFQSGQTLQQELNTFRFWYNHIRPHQYLEGLTPFEAYHGIDSHSRKNTKHPAWFEAWEGRLTGFWFQRE